MSTASSTTEGTGSADTRLSPAQSNDELKSPPSPERRVSERQHVDVDYFAKEGDEPLRTKLTRTATQFSTHPQDPLGDDYDFAADLQDVLRKNDRAGVLRREVGVSFQNLTVQGDGSGLAFGPSMGDILAGPARLPAKIKASR